MGRPPSNSNIPDAKERMENAFWKCLEEKPFDKITVRDIVTRAQVNRNTYYYHYEDMGDLAKAAIDSTIAIQFANAIISGNSSPAELAQTVMSLEDREKRFANIRLIASSHGSPMLLEHVKGIIVNAWLHAFDLQECDLPESARTAITFVFGGITAIWASPNIGFNRLFSAILSTDLVSHNIGTLRRELEKAAEIKASKANKPR